MSRQRELPGSRKLFKIRYLPQACRPRFPRRFPHEKRESGRPSRPSADKSAHRSTFNRQSRSGFRKPRLPCGTRPLPFGRPVQTAPALRAQSTPSQHSSGALAAGATQPRREPDASQLRHPPSRGVHTRPAPCSLPTRWEAGGAVHAPAFLFESPTARDVLFPMPPLASPADAQADRSRPLQTRLTDPPQPSCLARFLKSRTVAQPDAASADAPPVEVTRWAQTPAPRAQLRREPWRRWRWPVDQFISTVPD